MKICEYELKFPVLKTVHRLDRQTSGIVFFAKEEVASNDFRQAMIGGKVQKVYYARVMGDFRDVCNKPEEGEEEITAKCEKSVYCISNVEAKWDCNE